MSSLSISTQTDEIQVLVDQVCRSESSEEAA